MRTLRRWWGVLLAVVLVAGGLAWQVAEACNTCSTTGGCFMCELRSAVMYAQTTLPTDAANPPDPAMSRRHAVDLRDGPARRVIQRQQTRTAYRSPGEDNCFLITFRWDAGTNGGWKKWCFITAGPRQEDMVGDYTLMGGKGETTTALVHYSSPPCGGDTQSWFESADHHYAMWKNPESHEFELHDRTENKVILSATNQDGQSGSVQEGNTQAEPSNYENHMLSDGQTRSCPTQITRMQGGQVVSKTYFRFHDSNPAVDRKRQTVEEYNSDHNPGTTNSMRFQTTIHVYYPDGKTLVHRRPGGRAGVPGGQRL